MQKGLSFTKFLFLLVLSCTFVATSVKAQSVDSGQAGTVELYSLYSYITVTPGQKINYSIKLINNTNTTKDVRLYLYGLPKSWSGTMKSGGWQIRSLSVLPHKKQTIKVNVKVPLQVKRGSYRFHIEAKGYDNLPLTIRVSKSGTYKTAFSTKQPNLKGATSTKFTFNGTLKNATADTEFYSLRAHAPRGWSVQFKASYKQVASVKINPNDSKNLTIAVNPPDHAKAGTYKIPLYASSGNTSANCEISVTITGSYGLSLSTPTGRLSADITAGHTKKVTLTVTNTQSATLKDIKLSATAPADWHVTFNPQKIDVLAPGKTDKVTAVIKASKDAIAGDYVTSMTAKTSEASSQAKFRMSVKTSPIWGWLGIVIIIIALLIVYALFRKFGRR